MNSEDLEFQIRQTQNSIKYDLRSYSIDMLIRKFRYEEFYIPRYQRSFVWNSKNQSLFIESIIMGLPTSLFIMVQTSDGRLEIIDGVQRIKTIEAYTNGDLTLKNLESITALNNTKFIDLPISQQRKFLSRSINLIILSDETSIEDRMEIFKRMNIGLTLRNSNELRNRLYEGAFLDFVKELAEINLFNEILHTSNFMKIRNEREDFIIKFFALSDNLENYKKDMNSFLSEFLALNKNDFNREKFEEEFRNTLIFIHQNFRNFIVHRHKEKLPMNSLQNIFVGVNLALKENTNLDSYNIDWIFSEHFIQISRFHAVQSPKRIKESINFVKNELLKNSNR